jgi:hypothetical protein
MHTLTHWFTRRNPFTGMTQPAQAAASAPLTRQATNDWALDASRPLRGFFT